MVYRELFCRIDLCQDPRQDLRLTFDRSFSLLLVAFLNKTSERIASRGEFSLAFSPVGLLLALRFHRHSDLLRSRHLSHVLSVIVTLIVATLRVLILLLVVELALALIVVPLLLLVTALVVVLLLVLRRAPVLHVVRLERLAAGDEGLTLRSLLELSRRRHLCTGRHESRCLTARYECSRGSRCWHCNLLSRIERHLGHLRLTTLRSRLRDRWFEASIRSRARWYEA